MMGSSLVRAIAWSAATIGLYLLAKRVYRRVPSAWTAPLPVTLLLLAVVTSASHTGYREYFAGTEWLVRLLGPATVAFAVPIYEQRTTIRRHWPVLAVAVVVGSVTALVSAWGFATLLGLPDSLRLSLLPRSLSTPFAMKVSSAFGGVPEITAVFVVITGVLGASFGEVLLRVLPLRSGMARGALFGMGAHAVGVAKAYEVGREEGSIAGLVMVLVGVVNVLVAPAVAALLRR